MKIINMNIIGFVIGTIIGLVWVNYNLEKVLDLRKGDETEIEHLIGIESEIKLFADCEITYLNPLTVINDAAIFLRFEGCSHHYFGGKTIWVEIRGLK